MNIQVRKILKSTLLVASLASLSSLGSADAALIAYEGFNYTAGADINGQNGGTGFSGAWGNQGGAGTTHVISSPGYTYSGLATEGNKYNYSSTDIFRSLTLSPETAGTSLYISFLGQSGGSSFAGLSLFNNTTETLFMGTNGSGANRMWGINPLGGTAVSSTTHITTQSFVVYRIDFFATSATISLFVNPTAGEGSTEPLIASATTTKTAALAYDRIRISGGAANSFIDEVRIGQTWADVVPVPEPSTLALFAASCGVILMLRRRNGKHTAGVN